MTFRQSEETTPFTALASLRGRRGIATVVVFFVLLVLSIGIFSYFSFMRARRLLQYRQLFGEFAYELARAAMELTRAEVEAGLLDPTSTVSKALLTGMDDPAWTAGTPVDLMEINFPTDYTVLVNKVAESFEGGIDDIEKLTSRVYALPDDSTAFDPPAWVTKVLDTRQKYGRLFIEVESVFRAGAFEKGVSRKLLGYMEYRVVSPILPVFNHFTLFLSNVTDPAAGFDQLNASQTNFDGKLSDGKGPVVLSNGDTGQDNQFKNLQGSFLAKQGWVYLGGDKEIILNLAFGFGDHDQEGEDFMFYQDSPDPNLKETQRAYADTRINSKLPDTFWEVRYWDMGVSKMEDDKLSSSRLAFDMTDPGSYGSSVLHLNGAPRKQISPTLVMGNVSAGLLRLSAANPKGTTDNDLFQALFTLLPTMPAGGGGDPMQTYLDQLPKSGNTLDSVAAKDELYMPGKMLWVNPSDMTIKSPPALVTQQVYAEMMSKLTTRPYNQGLLYLSSENHVADPIQQGVKVPNVPPGYFAPGADPSEDPRSKLPAELLGDSESGAIGDPDLESVLNTAAASFPDMLKTCRVSGQESNPVRFLEDRGYLKNGKLDLGTVLVWEAKGPVALPKITNLVRGGILVADEFHIQGIEPESEPADADARAPLMLYARDGNIKIADRSRVHAILVAPKGLVEAPKGFDISGAIYAKGIDFAKSFNEKVVSHMRYNPRYKVGPWSKGAPGPPPEWSLIIDHSSDFVMVQ